MTLLRNTLHTKSSQRGSSRKSSSHLAPRRGPFARLERLWWIIFGSLLLDPLLTQAELGLVEPKLAERIAIITSLVLLPFLAQESLYRGIAALRNINARQLERQQQLLPIVSGTIVALVMYIKVLQLTHLTGIWVIGIAVFIMLLALQAIMQTVRKTWKHTQNLQRDGWNRLELWEQQLVLLALTPQILARGISLSAALSQQAQDQWLNFLLHFTVSALFLGMLRPHRRFFVGFCRTCKQPVPIVFVNVGGCLRCDENLRNLYEQSRHQK